MVGGAGPYSQSDRLMMTCSSDTQCWEPVKGRDEPFAGLSCACAGVVHEDDLYVIGSKCEMKFSTSGDDGSHAEHAAVLYKFKFWHKLWECSRLPENPAFSTSSLLAACNNQLIMFGTGDDSFPKDALWRLDIKTATWQVQACSGDRPHPKEACALAIQNGRAYLLTANLVNHVGLIIYELDLETWHWCRLPAAPTPFFLNRGYGRSDTIATSVAKGCWVVMGGAYCFGDQPDQKYSHLQVFGFTKLSWVATPLGDMHLPCRKGHMAACHNGAVFVMEGSHAEGLPGYILCIQGEANGYYWHDNGSVLRNCRCGTALDPSYTDITFCVEGQEFQLHKAVLAAASPVFDCMFRSNMQQAVTGKVVLHDIAADTMELLVSWMYHTVDKPLTLPQAVDLFEASDRFDVLDLHQACGLIVPDLVFNLNPWRPDLSVYRLWQIAAAIGSGAMVRMCRRHLSPTRLGRLMLAGDDDAVNNDRLFQDLLRDFVPQAAAPDDLKQATCASTQQADPKLQHEAEGAGGHDVDGDYEADSVVDADTVDWIEEAQADPPSPPAELCYDSQLRAANIFSLLQHRSPAAAAGLGVRVMGAPGLGVVLEGRSTASCGQAYSRTIDISARCYQSQETGQSRAFADNAGKATVLGHRQADPELQNETEDAAVHDVDGDDEADSVVDADNVDWIEEAQADPLLPPAEVCFNSQLRAANNFNLSQPRSPAAAAGLGVRVMGAPGLGVVLEGRSTASWGQAYSRTIDISARCYQSQETGKSRDFAGKTTVLGHAAGALGRLAKGYSITAAVASLGMLAASSSPFRI